MTLMVPESIIPKTVLTVNDQAWQLVMTLEDRGYVGVAFCITDPTQDPVTTNVPMHRVQDAWQSLMVSVGFRTGVRKNAGAEFRESREFAKANGHDVSKW